MKLRVFIYTILVFTSAGVFAQQPVNGLWRYSFTDSPGNASAGFDDARWQTKPAGELNWVKKDFPADSRTVWLRKTFVISSALKKELSSTGILSLSLGRVQQEDDTYLNGKLIGQTKSGDLLRVYLLNDSNILWDKENTIAIRIHHWGDVCAVTQVPVIAGAEPDNIFTVSAISEGATAKDKVGNKKVSYDFIVNNNSPRGVQAIVKADFFNISGQKIYEAEKGLLLKPGADTAAFIYRSPVDFVKVIYHLSVPRYTFSVSHNAELGFTDITYKKDQPIVPDKAPEVFKPAGLDQQQITGWLGDRLKANRLERLYKVDEPALLAGFINKPGIHPWIGEHAGKFLDAACNTYQNTHDPALKVQIDRTAQQLIAAQAPDGYLGTYDSKSHWTSWDVWSHKYDLIGLLNYYATSGYQPALRAAEKIGNLMCKTFGNAAGQLDIIKAGTHEGMAATSILDPMTDLYRYSGKKEYLNFCYYITGSYDQPNGPKIISTLDSIGRVDKTANAKAYEMLSNLVGLVKLYRVTGNRQFLKPVLNAWKDVAEKRLYITGTTSSFEHFQDDNLLPAGAKDNMGEGCVTTTWLQLNYNLLCLTGEMRYLNELERSVYNHLTGAENPETGCVSYYTPLMGVKPYGCNITCCMSSVPRGIAMIPLFTNGQINNNPSFLFYQPGVYKTMLGNVAHTHVTFTTHTTFPSEGAITITVDPDHVAKFGVTLRKPYWAANFKVKVNGVAQSVPGLETFTLSRNWKKGDKIAVNFDMPLRALNGGQSYPGTIAFQRGPQVLVIDGKLNTNLAFPVMVSPNVQLSPASSALPAKWIGNQAYQVNGKINGDDAVIILVPYADASQTGGEVTTWIKEVR